MQKVTQFLRAAITCRICNNYSKQQIHELKRALLFILFQSEGVVFVFGVIFFLSSAELRLYTLTMLIPLFCVAKIASPHSHNDNIRSLHLAHEYISRWSQPCMKI